MFAGTCENYSRPGTICSAAQLSGSIPFNSNCCTLSPGFWKSVLRKVESIVRECTAVDEFQILLTRPDLLDEITVLVELKPGREDHWTHLHQRLCRDLPAAHEGLRFNVQLAEPNSLPRFELKAKRLVDKRPAPQFT
jgi:hypothetical protein